jgi:hypothetical protein
LEEETARHFAGIVQLARTIFNQVTFEVDVTPARSILRLQADYGRYRIVVKELFNETSRKYGYYALVDEWVEIGFDNSPDPKAIRLKYGEIGEEHAGEEIPHLHLKNKTQISLTEEMTFAGFVEWLKQNL